MTKQEEQAKAYRNYREECGVESPTVLDEIEEAFYQGMLKQEEMMKKAAIKAEVDSSRSDGKCMLSGNFFKYNNGEKVKLVILND